jgi:ABC-type multidrug transport system fused ATPase/permease subunit
MLTTLLYTSAVLALILVIIYAVAFFATMQTRKNNIRKLENMMLTSLRELDELQASINYNFTHAQCQKLMRTFQNATKEEWDNLTFKLTGDPEIDALLVTLEPKKDREGDRLAHATYCWLMDTFPSFEYLSDKHAEADIKRSK